MEKDSHQHFDACILRYFEKSIYLADSILWFSFSGKYFTPFPGKGKTLMDLWTV
jgi:hypothetical protein